MDGGFEDYVKARGRAFLRFAFVLSGDRYLAEDLVQEVLARVHLRWERVATVEQPDAYVRTAIVRSAWPGTSAADESAGLSDQSPWPAIRRTLPSASR